MSRQRQRRLPTCTRTSSRLPAAFSLFSSLCLLPFFGQRRPTVFAWVIPKSFENVLLPRSSSGQQQEGLLSPLHISTAESLIIGTSSGRDEVNTGTNKQSSSQDVAASVAVVPTEKLQQIETPLDQWLQDVMKMTTATLTGIVSTAANKDKDIPQTSVESLSQPIPSGQNQIPVIDRVAKAIHEESLPWIIASILPLSASAALNDLSPMLYSASFELAFLTYCSAKILLRFNKPTTPQPMLASRQWDHVRESVWASHPTLEARREFLMGWFFDAPFDQLRREDALSFLSFKRYGLPFEGNYLSKDQIESLLSEDLPRLRDEVNDGRPLLTRGADEKPLGCMRFNLEPLRYRHKPLVFYGVTHGAFHLVRHTLKKEYNFDYTPAADAGKDIAYWYRAPSCPIEEANPPLVFVHGVGGLSFYYPLISKLTEDIERSGDNTPIILLDLPQVSLRINDDIPSVASSVESVCNILDKTVGSNAKKATMVGHSFGSLILSWMVQSRPDRVSNCIFLDPIVFQLHQKDILFNFHMKRADHRSKDDWSNPFSIGALINLAGTEMHTNNAMLRHFWWTSNALWPSDILKNDISACVLLSEKDEIVPSSDVAKLFEAFNQDGEKKNFFDAGWDNLIESVSSLVNDEGNAKGSKPFVKAKLMEEAGHGDFVFDEDKQRQVIRTIKGMLKLNAIKHQQEQAMQP
mmetsp:Transcript_173/g.447  ORF Transcript_173/g.447 Transcript_173/m.447 type:complete len:692 (+) Transcript_173:149-2224(+)